MRVITRHINFAVGENIYLSRQWAILSRAQDPQDKTYILLWSLFWQNVDCISSHKSCCSEIVPHFFFFFFSFGLKQRTFVMILSALAENFHSKYCYQQRASDSRSYIRLKGGSKGSSLGARAPPSVTKRKKHFSWKILKFTNAIKNLNNRQPPFMP